MLLLRIAKAFIFNQGHKNCRHGWVAQALVGIEMCPTFSIEDTSII